MMLHHGARTNVKLQFARTQRSNDGSASRIMSMLTQCDRLNIRGVPIWLLGSLRDRHAHNRMEGQDETARAPALPGDKRDDARKAIYHTLDVYLRALRKVGVGARRLMCRAQREGERRVGSRGAGCRTRLWLGVPWPLAAHGDQA